MPRKTSDPLQKKLYQVNQRIYRISKKGFHSEALKIMQHNIDVLNRNTGKNATLSNFKKWSEKERKSMNTIMDAFLSSKTSSVAGIKATRKTHDKIVTDFMLRNIVEDMDKEQKAAFKKLSTKQKQLMYATETLTDSQLDTLYNMLEYARYKSDLYDILGSEQAYKAITESVKRGASEKAIKTRITQAMKYAKNNMDTYTEEDIQDILNKTVRVSRDYSTITKII